MNAKYDAGMTVEFLDPEVNGSYAVRPVTVIALTDGDFTGSPTRWTAARRREPAPHRDAGAGRPH